MKILLKKAISIILLPYKITDKSIRDKVQMINNINLYSFNGSKNLSIRPKLFEVKRRNVDNNSETIKPSMNYHPLLKAQYNISFGSQIGKIVGEATVIASKTPCKGNIVAKKISNNAMSLSLIAENQSLGFANIVFDPNKIKILLIEKTADNQDFKRIGSNLLQTVIEIALKMKKNVVLDSVRVDEMKDNPILFYISRGFEAKDKIIHRQILDEIDLARQEKRKPDSNIFDNLGAIEMILTQENMNNWKKLISLKPILF